MAFVVYRLSFNDPLSFYEQLGDPITTQGGAPVPAVRGALRHAVSLSTLGPSEPETIAGRLKLRRQFRSLANNTPMKLTGLFLGWEADTEQNGWYLPDQGQLVDLDGSSGLANGVFKVENFVWTVAGHPRTHRRAMAIYLKDLRTGLWARDPRRAIYSTDFSGLSTLPLTYFGPGTTDLLSTGSVKTASAIALPSGADGGACSVVEGLLDLARVSYEQGEASRNLGQVVAYDRRGELTAPTGGPGTAWEEFYGPDYAYSWLLAGGTMDAPVLENGRCRVRYESFNTGGWSIDVWTGSKWEEQGKVLVQRRSTANNYDRELISASLVEYNETRAIIQAVMRAPGDANSREEIFITLQRGWSGPRFDVYPANNAAGAKVDAALEYTLALLDTDDSVIKIDSGGGVIAATAEGTGHTGLWEASPLGAGAFTGENDLAIARWEGVTAGTPYGVMIAVLQAAVEASQRNNSEAYSSVRNAVAVRGPGTGLGYVAAQYGFAVLQDQQVLEAENMTLGSGSTVTTNAEGSNGKTVTATRTTDANAHVTNATWPNGDEGTYRVFVRAKTSVGTSKLKLYAKTTATTGATKETAITALGWVDLGDIVSNGSTLEIHAWLSAAGTLSVDRVEAFLVEDRNTANGGIYEGARDLGQRTLLDSRTTPTVVTRTV